MNKEKLTKFLFSLRKNQTMYRECWACIDTVNYIINEMPQEQLDKELE